MNLKYIQLPFTIFNFRSYVEQPSLFMTKLKVEERELMNLIFKNLINYFMLHLLLGLALHIHMPRNLKLIFYRQN